MVLQVTLVYNALSTACAIRPGQVDSQFIVTVRMHLNAPAWNFIIGILDRNTLIEQSFLL